MDTFMNKLIVEKFETWKEIHIGKEKWEQETIDFKTLIKVAFLGGWNSKKD